MAKNYSFNRHAIIVVSLLVLTLTLFLWIPMLSTTRLIAENSLEKMSRRVNIELSRSVFPMLYIDHYIQNWQDGDLVTNLTAFAKSNDNISSLTIINNDKIIGLAIEPDAPPIVHQLANNLNNQEDHHLEAGPFYQDQDGMVYLQIILNHYLEASQHYQFILMIKSPYLQKIIDSERFYGSYLFLQVEKNSTVTVLPLFKGFYDDIHNGEIARLAWSNHSSNEAVFSSFKYKQNNYLAWINPLLSTGDDGTIGLIVPQKLIAQPLQRITIPISLLLLMGTTIYIFIILSIFIRFKKGRDSIDDLIKEGESTSLEFKSSLRWDCHENKANVKILEAVIMKSVAAFSNANGGTVLIGVNDDGSIVGINHDYQTLKKSGVDFYELHLRSLISATYGESFCIRQITINFFESNGHDICAIKIKKGKKPLYSNMNGKEVFYIRSGNSSRMIEKPSELTDYIKGRFH